MLGSEASWKVFASDKLGSKERGHQPHREQGGRKQSEDHLGDKNAHRLRCGEFFCDWCAKAWRGLAQETLGGDGGLYLFIMGLETLTI